MKSFVWFVTGVVGGIVAGHLVANDPRGQALAADVTARLREFTDGVKQGFDERLADDSPTA
jgi:hypothetical protein